MKVLYSNPPWLEIGPDNNVRKGVRAGSRWPNTYPALCRENQWVEGHYIPYPFFMGYATSYAAKHCPDHAITMRDSVARNEGYKIYYEFLAAE